MPPDLGSGLAEPAPAGDAGAPAVPANLAFLPAGLAASVAAEGVTIVDDWLVEDGEDATNLVILLYRLFRREPLCGNCAAENAER